MRKTCLSLLLGLMSLPLHAGTIHQVFNETYSQSSALATIDLVTPPLVDESYLVTIYEDIAGDWISPNSDEVSPYINWTDDSKNTRSSSQPKIPKMVQSSDQIALGPYVAIFPVRVKANTHLTLTIPYSSPDNFTYNVSVQVQGW